MKRHSLCAGGMALVMLAGCANIDGTLTPGGIDGNLPTTGTFVPATTLKISPGYSLTLEQLYMAGLAGVALYLVYQPLAPNWKIQEAVLDGDSYYVRMEAKSFRTGGDGEAMMVLKRRAMELQRSRGFAGYKILDYGEGIESKTPFTHRFSEGIIKLVRADEIKP